MDKLTQDQAERCIKVLRWKEETDGVAVWYDDEAGEKQWCEWGNGLHQRVMLTDILFVRLWDRLVELGVKRFADRAHVFVQYDPRYYRKPYQAEADDIDSPNSSPVEADHPCLALCEAIEVLEKND